MSFCIPILMGLVTGLTIFSFRMILIEDRPCFGKYFTLVCLPIGWLLMMRHLANLNVQIPSF
jgi:hypothetical protein